MLPVNFIKRKMYFVSQSSGKCFLIDTIHPAGKTTQSIKQQCLKICFTIWKNTNQSSYDVHIEDQVKLYHSNKLNAFHKVTKAFDVGVVNCLVYSGNVLSVGHEVGMVVSFAVSSDSELTR